MTWFPFGGVLLSGVVFSDPAMMPLETTHLLFVVSSLAGFVLIPYWISELVKQPGFQAIYVATLDPQNVKPEVTTAEPMGGR